MRDAFIDEIYEAAIKDKDIVFISADFGAPALDLYREKLPDQFVHAGISEQDMVNIGVGFALSGKKVFLYAMAPFITTRCYEQSKAVVSSMQLPIVYISVGVGLGYDHATLTHFTTEDIAIMRALNGIEVISPVDAESASVVAQELVKTPKFSYIRLERYAEPDIYNDNFIENYDKGYCQLNKGKKIALVSCGHMMQQAIVAQGILKKDGIDAGLIDIFRVKPINTKTLPQILSEYDAIITIEEQMLDGGFGSTILELVSDLNINTVVKRVGIRDGFKVVNGNRDHLHKLYNIDVDSIIKVSMDALK